MEVLLDERLGVTTLEFGNDLPLIASAHDFVVRVLNPYHRDVFGTRLLNQLAHVRDHGVAAKRIPHDSVLNVDHKQCGVRSVLERAHCTLLPGNAHPLHVPTASNLNFVAGQTIPNLVMVKVAADGTFKIANTFGGSGGTVNIIVDIVGYYGSDGSAAAVASASTKTASPSEVVVQQPPEPACGTPPVLLEPVVALTDLAPVGIEPDCTLEINAAGASP